MRPLTNDQSPRPNHQIQPIALYYDDGAYREMLKRAQTRGAGQPQGLMGRQVAGKEFLDAWLEHGRWESLLAVTSSDAAAASLLETCQAHPSSRTRRRKLRHITEQRFHQDFLPSPPVSLLHFPTPPDPRFAWARRAGSPHGFALCGVTHTLCSLRAVEVLRGLLTDPWEPYDRLICTSRAVTNMVRQVIETFGAYLAERHGRVESGELKVESQDLGASRSTLNSQLSTLGLETIPLGVNTDRFRPATPSERQTERQRLGLDDDEIAVLFVGRLAHHAKAHPYPMFRGVSEAAQATGTKVRLLLVGWAANDFVLNAFRSAADEFGPHMRMDVLDGLDEKNRFGAWRAADIFCSLSDNIQETFGLVIVEAMASGLPVVATDWNGYRDLVVDGETGLLVPTRMIPGASAGLTSQLLFGSLDYNHFLAQSSQGVVVDTPATTAAFARLFRDPELRSLLGAAGRVRAVEEFAWSKIIRRYEALWEEQQTQLRSMALRGRAPGQCPEAYPPLETTFAGYPTSWLEDQALLQAAADGATRLAAVMDHPLTGYESDQRCTDAALLQRVLDAAAEPCAMSELTQLFQQDGVAEPTARATLAWLLKYDVLRQVDG